MSDAPKSASFARRLVWLFVCIAVGAGLGLAGYYVTGEQVWFLALPAALAVGWLVWANPEQCLPVQRDGPAGGAARKPH